MEVDHDAREPVYRQVAAILREAIEQGEYPPGRAVPSEAALVQAYGIARETARKAHRVLQAEGLLQIVQGRGAYVTDRKAEP